jgi:multisubunit Na+/H+ antiporter MnhB subunit
MLKRWVGGLSALIVLAAITVLIVLDVTDPRFRRWWEERALTTSMVGGLLVLSVTILVVDQVGA